MSHFILIYGLSGSGKSTAARVLEDNGVVVIQNLPPRLLRELGRSQNDEPSPESIAVIPELNCEGRIFEVIAGAAELIEQGHKVTEIFLDSSDESLINRYKESRRPHPMPTNGGILDAIHSERALFIELRRRAQYIIHTDSLKSAELKNELLKSAQKDSTRLLQVAFLSFGFKFGVPPEIDLCFDVRFVENPFFVPELKELSGIDEAVKAFVLEKSEAKKFLESASQMLDLLLPYYIREGKSYLTVGIGCTGGRHRSVALADALLKFCRGENMSCSSMHRDIGRRPSA